MRVRNREESLNLFAYEAKKYFLNPKHYFSVPLPPYFRFETVLNKLDKALEDKDLTEFYKNGGPAAMKNVNFALPASKSDNYAWRTFEVIHPAIYVEMVKTVTRNWDFIRERFRLFKSQDSVLCTSLAPGAESRKNVTAASILKWWHGMEQATLKMSIYYDYVVETDIMECYNSIPVELLAKAFGNQIGDSLAGLIRDSRSGHTVGIPQGSILIDFLAEGALGYLDVLFHNAIKDKKLRGKFTILRYRDDYRIFARDGATVELLLKTLSDVLAPWGMKLNPHKTKVYDNLVAMARKKDKTVWETRASNLSIQKQLLSIYDLSLSHPNSGSLQRALLDLYSEEVIKLEHRASDSYPLIGILINLAVENPRTAGIVVAFLSKLLSFNPGISRNTTIDSALAKADIRPGSEYLEVCFQRLYR